MVTPRWLVAGASFLSSMAWGWRCHSCRDVGVPGSGILNMAGPITSLY